MSKISPIFNSFNSVAGLPRQIVGRQKHPNVIAQNNNSPTINPWQNEKTIHTALNELEQVQFDVNDVNYLKNMGVQIKFNSGKEAVDFIYKKNIKIKFHNISSNSIFAQYDHKNNAILINENYKSTTNQAEILAISEAILHECGHSIDEDYNNSIQEEINNLALNTLAHKFYSKKYPQIFKTSNSLIVQDGVNVYADLFFDKDPAKQALVNRLKLKYGFLPSHDRKHQLTDISRRVKENNN